MMNGFSKVYWVWSSLDFVGEKVMFDGLCETYWIYVCLIPYFTKKKLYFWEPPARIKSFISKFQFQGRYWDLLCHSSRLRQRTKLIIETEIFYILHLHFISQAIQFLMHYNSWKLTGFRNYQLSAKLEKYWQRLSRSSRRLIFDM